MRTLMELAQFLSLREAAQQLVRVQNTLCTTLFHEPNPTKSIFLLSFCAVRCPSMHCHWLSEAKVRHYADSLILLFDLSPTIEPLKSAIGYWDALQEAEQNDAREDGGLLSHDFKDERPREGWLKRPSVQDSQRACWIDGLCGRRYVGRAVG